MLRRQPGRAEQAPGVAVERQQQDPLRGRSGDVSVTAAAVDSSLADGRPVGGAVDRPMEARRIHERLQEQQRMMMARLPVGADAPGAERQEPRAEVPLAPWKQQPHVVGDQVQPPELLAPAPSDPRVARAALERHRREGGQRRPFAAAVIGRMPDGLADLRRRTEIVVLVHERAEARLLVPRHGRHGQLREIHCGP